MMYGILVGIIIILIIMLIIANNTCKDLNKKEDDYKREIAKLTNRIYDLNQECKYRGVTIKTLKTELYKPKPKKQKEQVKGLFIKTDNIIDYSWADGSLVIEITDNTNSHLNTLIKLDKRKI